MAITPAQLAEWQRIIREQGALHSALAQRIAPGLLDALERAWAELERHRRRTGDASAAALKSRIAERPASAAATRAAATATVAAQRRRT